MKTIIRKELKLLLRGKGNFFFLIVMPAQFIVLFGSVFSTANMLDSVVPRYTVMFVFFIIMSMMRSFIGEKESGMLARLLSAHIPGVADSLGILLGFGAAGFLVALLRFKAFVRTAVSG